ncbi:LacI family DNA-binding transcriptional regulator [Nocardioides sp.]|uniref:LacI family DNA-binding transcriptional regulator n=1 Tax=Nocardioides sp. TaxID=35761 RepID=UPI0035B0E443
MVQPERNSGRRVTLDDVAARAGVSRAMASIVMREAPGASETTRARVLSVAKDLGYRPDIRARALASTQSRLIGVLFGAARRYHFELLEGLYAAAEKHGYNLVLSALTGDRSERRAIEALQDFRLDALVMLGPATDHPLMSGQVPVVVVGWHTEDPDVDSVRHSDAVGMDLAVDHLVGIGHRDIWHLDGGKQLVADARTAGYEEAMARRGLGAHTRVITGGEDQLDGQLAANRILEHDRLPTAVIAYNDDTAAAAMSVFAQQGIRVPEHISVIGWDDSALAATPAFNLTSVGQRPPELAERTIERLIARLDGSSVALEREVILDPHLTLRGSTAAPGPRSVAAGGSDTTVDR